MNKKLMPYYISRTILSIAFGALFFISGAPLWEAILVGGSVLGLFLWAPHSRRYAVHPELGVTALRRDERAQVINDKAARNAFAAIMLLTGAVSIFAGMTGIAIASSVILRGLLIAGVVVYYSSDLWLRKSQG